MTTPELPDTTIEAAARVLAVCNGHTDWDLVFSQPWYLDNARAVLTAALPHLPTVKPDRDTIALALKGVLWNASNYPNPAGMFGRDFTDLQNLCVRAVLAVLPGRTEAQVAADALEEAARAVGHADDCPLEPDRDPYFGCRCRMSLLYARAARIRAGAER